MSLTGLRTRPGSSGSPVLSAMATRSSTDQVHSGPLGNYQEMDWNSLVSTEFSLSTGRIRVPVSGIYLCTVSFSIIGVASLTQLTWEWLVDGVDLGLPVSTTQVPLAGEQVALATTAEIEINETVNLQWKEAGANGSALAVNSNIFVLFLKRP